MIPKINPNVPFPYSAFLDCSEALNLKCVNSPKFEVWIATGVGGSPHGFDSLIWLLKLDSPPDGLSLESKHYRMSHAGAGGCCGPQVRDEPQKRLVHSPGYSYLGLLDCNVAAVADDLRDILERDSRTGIAKEFSGAAMSHMGQTEKR